MGKNIDLNEEIPEKDINTNYSSKNNRNTRIVVEMQKKIIPKEE